MAHDKSREAEEFEWCSVSSRGPSRIAFLPFHDLHDNWGARNRGIAATGAAIGAAVGVDVIAVVALLAYIGLLLGTGVHDDYGRMILAAFVLYIAAPSAIVMGLIGCR